MIILIVLALAGLVAWELRYSYCQRRRRELLLSHLRRSPIPEPSKHEL